MAPVVVFTFLLVVFTTCFTHGSKNALPEGMHQDLYCIGCEMTMKVLEGALRNVAADKLEAVVPETLRKVCKPDHFKISEYSKETLNAACKHIIKNYGAELKSELVKEYSQGKRSSYLNLVQQVCLKLTDACHGVLHDDHDHDPLTDNARVKLDPETNEFVVLPGKNLKMPNPVRAHHHEEL